MTNDKNTIDNLNETTKENQQDIQIDTTDDLIKNTDTAREIEILEDSENKEEILTKHTEELVNNIVIKTHTEEEAVEVEITSEIEDNNDFEEQQDENNVTDIKDVEGTQENNDHVKPTSSRKDVEVDKIFKLLKDAKDELKNKNTYEKTRKERIDKILNDIPKSTIEKLEKEVTETITENEKEVIPEIKNDIRIPEEVIKNQAKLNSQKSSNVISYLLIVIVLILSYLLFDSTNNNAQHIQNKSMLTFDDLPQALQKEYISKKVVIKAQNQTKELIEKSTQLIDRNNQLQTQLVQLKTSVEKNIGDSGQSNNRDLLKEIKSLKNEQSIYSNKVVSLRLSTKNDKNIILKLNKQIQSLQKNNKLLIDKEKSVSKKVLPTKNTAQDKTDDKYSKVLKKEVFPAITSKSKNYKILKCYDLKPGAFYLTGKCKKDITKFAKDNSRAIRFEIIGVVDKLDFTSVYKKDLTSKNAIELQKYNSMGLARYRVLETSWYLNELLKSSVLTPVNYTITSKKNNRGSIIRAYYK